MDFELSEDQLELRRVVRDVAERECTPALVRGVVEKGDDAAGLWSTYVSLDWPGLAIAEADGGLGMTGVELVLVLDELGRVADPTPFLATTTQYVPLVRQCADNERRRALLGAVCSGATGAAAFAADTVRGERSGDGWKLHGTARFVVDGDRADRIAVAASTPNGAGVFVVAQEAVDATRVTTFDASMHVAHLSLDGVKVGAEEAFVGTGVERGIAGAYEEAVVGTAALLVGASQRIFEMALDHIKSRHQFGVPIGSFQALKHMAVDVYVAIERARALTQFAALVVAEDDDRRNVAASMAKAAAGDAQRIAAQHGIQFFGGLGFTWENDLQLFVRRAKALELLFGTSASHTAKVARLALAEAAR